MKFLIPTSGTVRCGLPHIMKQLPLLIPRCILRGGSLLIMIALIGVLSSAAAADSSAVVFVYHRFGESEYPSTNIRLEQFDAEIEYLRKNKFNVWPLEKVVEHLLDSREIPDKTVAITIDDAYQSVYTEAYPRLASLGWPFTIFVSTDAVDKGYSSMMTWEQMREMSRNGATIANHGTTHAYLARREKGETKDEWLGRARAEITNAQERIAAEIGRAPKIFAYPYGEYNRALASLVAEMGYVGFGQQSGAVGAYSDTRALARYPVAEAFAEMGDFIIKARSKALPVRSVRPWDPFVKGPARPSLELVLAPVEADLDRLACYISGQGRVEVEWLDRKERRMVVTPPKPLGIGTSRYNCTAPSLKSNRYYWYSHPWYVVE